MTVLSLAAPLLRDALHTIAPELCPGCGALLRDGDAPYCESCRASLDAAPLPSELLIDISSQLGQDALALAAIGSLYAFEQGSVVQRLVHAVKYHGCLRLGRRLGEELGAVLRLYPEFRDTDCVVPVPQHRARRRQRGYNQAEAVARGVADAVRARLDTHSLLRRRNTRSQTTLDAEERRVNTTGAFLARTGAVEGLIVMVVDDVCTTGATLNECATALLDAGASRVTAATLARDMPGRLHAAQSFDPAWLVP